MLRRIKEFSNSSEGAVSTDWIVLTSALVGLAIAVVAVFGNSTQNVGDVVGDKLSAMGSSETTTF